MTPYLLHTGLPVTWTAWRFDPPVVGGAVIAIGAYIIALQWQQQPRPLRLTLAFLAGVAAVLVALISPLDAAAGHLLALHMLQHVLLSSIAAPLIVLGLPDGVVDHFRWPRLLVWGGRILVNPLFAGPVFIVVMWVWHIPPIYEQALQSQHIHEMMHAMFLGSGILFWWPVLRPGAGGWQLSDGAKMLYLFVSGFPMDLLALLLIASGSVIYRYYDLPPFLWGIKPLADQQVAGLIMGAVGEAASFIALTLLFVRFLDRDPISVDLEPALPADEAVSTL